MIDPTQLATQQAAPAPPASMPAPAPISSPASTATPPPPPKPNLENVFVRRAMLYNQMADAQAQRLAAATSQPPANSTDMAPKSYELARAWNFSPSQNPAQDFWALHDQKLQQNLAQVPPGSPPEAYHAAHNDAETRALNAVYPYRAELVGIGVRQLEDQVAQATRIKRLVEGQSAGAGGDVAGTPSTAPAPAPAAAPAAPGVLGVTSPPVIGPPPTPGGPPALAPTGGPV